MSGRPVRPHRRHRTPIPALALGVLLAASAALAAPPPSGSAKAPPSRTPKRTAATSRRPTATTSVAELARTARLLDEAGAYTRAVETLRQLRRRVASDADLELTLAIDEARADMLDSARVRLWGPALSAALVDSMPTSRRHIYVWEREALFLNGRFDGWNWYVARARFEVAATLGRWSDAHAAARAAVAARPLAGKEWLALALAASRDGAADESRDAAAQALSLDASLPEAHYVVGLLDWQAGRRAAAQERFRAAVGLDSSYQAAAIALVRAGLPGAKPDSLPAVLLTGAREAGLLTSAMRPKLEEFEQMDSPAVITRRGVPKLPDSILAAVRNVDLIVPVLVDEHGRAVLHELPWYPTGNPPAPVVAAVIASLPDWRFGPARKNGLPQRVWAAVEYTYKTVGPGSPGHH